MSFTATPRLALEKVQDTAPTDNEKFAGFAGHRISGAGLTIEHRNFSEQITGT